MNDCFVLAASFVTIAGLFLDLIGFVLVILYGHALFIRMGSDPPQRGEGRDGDLYLQTNAPDYGKRLSLARIGVALVITGFLAQIAGAAIGLR